MTTTEPEVKWSQAQMVEVTLNEPDDFLKVRETLTRIGVASRKEKKLYQSCHILHKQGRYYIVHFKELFALDGKHANLTGNDVQRRNRIARLLADWGLISVVKEESSKRIVPAGEVRNATGKDLERWKLAAEKELHDNFRKLGAFHTSTETEKRAYGRPLPMLCVWAETPDISKCRACVCGNFAKTDPTQQCWTAQAEPSSLFAAIKTVSYTHLTLQTTPYV